MVRAAFLGVNRTENGDVAARMERFDRPFHPRHNVP
jgi:hypothetical protein